MWQFQIHRIFCEMETIAQNLKTLYIVESFLSERNPPISSSNNFQWRSFVRRQVLSNTIAFFLRIGSSCQVFSPSGLNESWKTRNKIFKMITFERGTRQRRNCLQSRYSVCVLDHQRYLCKIYFWHNVFPVTSCTQPALRHIRLLSPLCCDKKIWFFPRYLYS